MCARTDVAQFGVGQCQVNGGLQEAFFAAAVVAATLVAKGIDLFRTDQCGNAIGQLDFTTSAPGLATNAFKTRGRQDVAPSHSQCGWRHLGPRFFHHGKHFGHRCIHHALHIDHAIAAGVLAGHILHRQAPSLGGSHRPATICCNTVGPPLA